MSWPRQPDANIVTWSMDFMADSFGDSRAFRNTQNVLDDFNRDGAFGFDNVEEALVRYNQRIDSGEVVPVTKGLLRARRALTVPWGWFPLTIFRTLLWLPTCGWTSLRLPLAQRNCSLRFQFERGMI